MFPLRAFSMGPYFLAIFSCSTVDSWGIYEQSKLKVSNTPQGNMVGCSNKKINIIKFRRSSAVIFEKENGFLNFIETSFRGEKKYF